MSRWWIVIVLLLGGCAGAPRVTPTRVLAEGKVTLHGHDLALHLSAPTPPSRKRDPVLLVFATGDAGWWGKDRAMFTHLVEWGYPAVGFSAREYVHHLGSDAVTPGVIARDYRAIIERSREALGLGADTRAVLVGKSRGAGLSVVAAGVPLLKPEIAGVVAIGLTREEEYVYHLGGRGPGQRVMAEMYPYLPRLGDVPLALIQSANDSYVPAEEARQLFGVESNVREFIAVNGSNHNFGGALETLYDEMEQAIAWIVQR